MILPWVVAFFDYPGWIAFSLIVPAIIFAAIMSIVAKKSDNTYFVTYFFEGVTVESAVVLLISLFYKPLFDVIAGNKAFLIIVASMTLIYGLRDIFSRVNQSGKDVRPDNVSTQDRMK